MSEPLPATFRVKVRIRSERTSAPVRIELDALCHSETKALLAYWQDMRHDRNMPAPSDFDPAAVRGLLPHISLIEVLPGPPPDYLFRVEGEAIKSALGVARMGRRLSDFRTDMGARYRSIVSSYEAACVERAPIAVRTTPRFAGRNYAAMEILKLPLSQDGKTVNRLLCAYCFTGAPEAALGAKVRPLAFEG